MNSSLYFCVAKQQCNYNCTHVVLRPNLCYHFAAPPTLSRLSLFYFRTAFWVAFIVGFFFNCCCFRLGSQYTFSITYPSCFAWPHWWRGRWLCSDKGWGGFMGFIDARKEGRACKRCAEAWRQQCWRVVQSARLTISRECWFYGCRGDSSATHLHASTTIGFEARNSRKFRQS